jgi:hypothetical protein
MPVSIVPKTEYATYLLLDEVGEYGNLWRETAEDEANEDTIVQWIIEGQTNHPVKVVAFNTEEGWSRDVTHQIATKLLDLNQSGVALGAAAREFVERLTGQTPIAVA